VIISTFTSSRFEVIGKRVKARTYLLEKPRAMSEKLLVIAIQSNFNYKKRFQFHAVLIALLNFLLATTMMF